MAPLRFLRGAAAGRFYETALTLGSIAGHAGLPAVTLPIATLAAARSASRWWPASGEDETLLAAAMKIA